MAINASNRPFAGVVAAPPANTRTKRQQSAIANRQPPPCRHSHLRRGSLESGRRFTRPLPYRTLIDFGRRSKTLNSAHTPMTFPRASGILLHPTSLPGPMASEIWAPKPIASSIFFTQPDTNSGRSFLSTRLDMAIRPSSVSRPAPAIRCCSISTASSKKEFSARPTWKEVPEWPLETVDFGRVIAYKMPLLKKAARNFLEGGPHTIAAVRDLLPIQCQLAR